jgi:thermostable 8-oxoguanine DNA glycosylase
MVRLLDKNTDEEIADALRLAVSAKTERGAMASLMGLEGVNVAVASAVMTAIRPRRYTVIDFRALHSLGVENRNGLSLGFYLEYLEFCRSLAKEQGVTLRELDRALWRWSKENP